MYIVRWLSSKAVRQAVDLRQQARKILAAQNDILSASDIAAINKAIDDLGAAVSSGASDEELNTRMTELERVASKHFKPYPSAILRENVEMFLTTTAVLLAVFTFFFQHFAIPTGSMQPTLYGVHDENHAGDAAFQIPNPVVRLFHSCVKGISYYHIVADTDGRVEEVESVRTLFPFVKRQRFLFAGKWISVWSPPPDLAARAELLIGRPFKKGEDIVKLKVTAGDHLFVNRVTYNFRHPSRGEIIIFASTGIPRLIQDTYYIKRLIATEGEKVRIGDDRHVIINGKRLDASTPHFENLYSFGDRPPMESTFSGHVNEKVAAANNRGGLAPLFPDASSEVSVGEGRFLVMGDNTMNSFDSRGWGDFPKKKVIGKASFVFWPISQRFGWGNR